MRAEHVEQHGGREEPAVVHAELDDATSAEAVAHLRFVFHPALGAGHAVVDPRREARHAQIRVALGAGGVDQLLPQRDHDVRIEAPGPEIRRFGRRESQRAATELGVHVDAGGAQRDLQVRGVRFRRDVHARLAPGEALGEVGDRGAEPLRVGLVDRAQVIAPAQVAVERGRRHHAAPA